MKIILKNDVDKVGKAGEIVEVARGYALNYLIPKGFAVQATAGNLKQYEHEQEIKRRRLQKEIDEAKEFAAKLENVSVTATVQVGEEDRVFGAVTNQTIAELLAKQGFEIDRKKIILEEPIKQLGVFEVPIRFHSEVEAVIKVWVVRE